MGQTHPLRTRTGNCRQSGLIWIIDFLSCVHPLSHIHLRNPPYHHFSAVMLRGLCAQQPQPWRCIKLNIDPHHSPEALNPPCMQIIHCGLSRITYVWTLVLARFISTPVGVTFTACSRLCLQSHFLISGNEMYCGALAVALHLWGGECRTTLQSLPANHTPAWFSSPSPPPFAFTIM